MRKRLHTLAPIVLMLLAVTFTSGCWKVRLKAPNVAPYAQRTQHTNFHFFWGLSGAQVLASECTEGMAMIKIRHPWWSLALLGPFTGGLVTATRVTYECAGDPRAEVPMNDLPGEMLADAVDEEP